MTVSTLGQHVSLAAYVGRAQSKLGDYQLQMASGKIAEVYSGLGSSAPTAINLHNRVQQMDGYRQIIQTVDSRAAAMDVSLHRIHASVTAVKTETIKSEFEGYDLTLLQARANDGVRELETALNLNLNGRYLFSGHMIDTVPMVDSATVKGLVSAAIVPGDTATTITNIDAVFATTTNFYQGDNGEVTARIDTATEVDYGITGDDAAFVDAAKGLYLLAVLDPATTDPDEYDVLRDWALGKLDEGQFGVNHLQAANGIVRQTLETVDQQHAQVTVAMKTNIADLEDADIYETINRIAMIKSQLEASYMMTAQLREMSLVNYLMG